MIPVWAPYNWDGLDLTGKTYFKKILADKKVIVSPGWNVPPSDPTDPNYQVLLDDYELGLDWVKDYVDPGQDPAEPLFDIAYPLLNNLDTVTIENPENEALVAFIEFNIFWRNMLENILPDTSRGVILVADTPCQQVPTVSFQIDGAKAKYLGEKDFHDPTYADMEISKGLFELSDLTDGDASYSGVPIDKDYCPWSLRLYPSELYEEDIASKDPMMFSFAVAGIFLFTSLVFICYDQGVEMRQRRVMSQANQSSAIVASLFPKAGECIRCGQNNLWVFISTNSSSVFIVRERMYQEAKEEKEREAKKIKVFSVLKPGFSNNLSSVPESSSMGEDSVAKGRPIADLCKLHQLRLCRLPAPRHKSRP